MKEEEGKMEGGEEREEVGSGFRRGKEWREGEGREKECEEEA